MLESKISVEKQQEVRSCFAKDFEDVEKLRDLGIKIVVSRMDLDKKLECTGYILDLAYFSDKGMNNKLEAEMKNHIGGYLVKYLIDNQDDLRKNEGQKGDLILYFLGEKLNYENFKHIGMVTDEGRIISKFCEFSVFEHPQKMVLPSFGNNFAYFSYSQEILQKAIDKMFVDIKNRKNK